MPPEHEVGQPIIIAVGFSRARSLARLLRSLNKAEYPHEVRLVISLDGEATADVVKVAREFEFAHGSLVVKTQPQRLGLREHILWAGDQTEEHGSVIVLEDDLVVDKYFYHYALSATKQYANESRIAGVALYSPRANENINLPFEPLVNNSSSYFMQVPCSWGQAWTRSQWASFRNWYDEQAKTNVLNDIDIPQDVKAWSESSWKKYFSAYLVDQDKYFSYPYRSYTTNFAQTGGTHVKAGTSVYQVPLADQSRQLESLDHDSFSWEAIVYDAYMEPNPRRLAKVLGVPPDELVVDIYGGKPKELLRGKKFALTTKKCSETIRAFDLTLKPIEQNVTLAAQNDSGTVSRSNFSPVVYLAESQNVVENKAKFIRLFQYYSFQRPNLRHVGLQYLLLSVIRMIDRLRRLF